MNLRSRYRGILLALVGISMHLQGQEASSDVTQTSAATESQKAPEASLAVDSIKENADQLAIASDQKKDDAPSKPEASDLEKTRVAELTELQKPVKKKTADVDTQIKPIIDQEGLDTMDQEGGNWLLKRKVLEDTVDLIEKISKLNNENLKARTDFMIRRNKANRDSEVFINEIGFELGDLSEALNALVQRLEAERTKEGDLTEEERADLEQVEKLIENVKKMQADIKAIIDLDGAIDDVVMQMESQIDKSNTYQMQAWKNFQTIKKLLSDEKATELYLQTEGLYKNLQDIKKYLNDTLQNYLSNTIAKQKSQMDSIKQSLEQLKSAGINLEKEIENVTQETEALERDLSMKQTPEKKETPNVSGKKAMGWFDYVKVIWEYPAQKMMAFWDYMLSFFESSKTVSPKVDATK